MVAVAGSDMGSNPFLDTAEAALDNMPPHVRERALALMKDRVEAQPLAEYITEHFPHEPPPAHILPIIKILERARHERIKVCLSLPPRHAKTVTILRAIGWWLKHEPADTCAYFSYNNKQAQSKSRIARRWAEHAGLVLDKDAQSVAEWRTPEGGGLVAGGLRGGLTGQGVSGLFIVDDPLKNREEADSRLIRDRVYEAFNEVVFTRLEGASVVVVHTRWHEDDLIGRLADDGWEVINIPAIAEEDDYLDRTADAALWASRFDRAELEDIKTQIGEWSFAALYQGRPQPRGHSVFNDPITFPLPAKGIMPWACTTREQRMEWAQFLHPPGQPAKRLVIACDPAASERTHADYSAAGVLAFDKLGPDGTCWVIDVMRGQWTIPVLVEKLRMLQRGWNARIVVEAVAGFKAVPQMLKHVDPSLIITEIHPTTDKFQRAQGVAAAWNVGRVLVPGGQLGPQGEVDLMGTAPEWVDPFLSEVLSFTGVKDKHDDQVDMLAHGWNAIASVRPRKPRYSTKSRGTFG